MPTSTTNYAWQKPDVGASADAWGGLINTDLDGIDSTVKSVSNAIPIASTTNPVMDGTVAVGVGTTWARADHVHPSDTSRYAASNPSGYQTAAQVIASLGAYLPLAGGTVTGSLTVNGSLNAASAVSLTAASGTARAISYNTGVGARWIWLANGTAESSTATGSDFQVNAFDNTAAYLGTPFNIYRANGAAYFNGNGAALVAAGGALGNAALGLNKAASGKVASLTGWTNGVLRWSMSLGDANAEASNAGSNFALAAFNDAGAAASPVPIPLSIARSTGVATFGVAIVNGPSDRTLKENIAPIEGALDKVLALQGVGFNMIATPDKREIGLIAQDVEPIVPEIVQDFQTHDAEGKAAEIKLALDYSKLTALLVEAVKELTARVQALEAA